MAKTPAAEPPKSIVTHATPAATAEESGPPKTERAVKVILFKR